MRTIHGFFNQEVGKIEVSPIGRRRSGVERVNEGSLGVINAVASEVDVGPREGMAALGVLAVLTQEYPTVTIKACDRVRTLYEHLAHGQPAVLRDMVCTTIAVEHCAGS
jgi:hypothetical protein